MKIYDRHGKEKDEAWVRREFGNILLSHHGSGEYAVSALRESVGPSALVVTVRRNGMPVSGVRVAFGWPDAPMLPDGRRADVGTTDGGGAVGFGMGRGAYYLPDNPKAGPHSVWIDGEYNTVAGLGMLAGTNHRHLNVEYDLRVEEEEEEEVSVGNESEIIQKLDRIIEMLEERLCYKEESVYERRFGSTASDDS